MCTFFFFQKTLLRINNNIISQQIFIKKKRNKYQYTIPFQNSFDAFLHAVYQRFNDIMTFY